MNLEEIDARIAERAAAYSAPLAPGEEVFVDLRHGGRQRGRVVRVNGTGRRVVVRLAGSGSQVERRLGEVERIRR